MQRYGRPVARHSGRHCSCSDAICARCLDASPSKARASSAHPAGGVKRPPSSRPSAPPIQPRSFPSHARRSQPLALLLLLPSVVLSFLALSCSFSFRLVLVISCFVSVLLASLDVHCFVSFVLFHYFRVVPSTDIRITIPTTSAGCEQAPCI